MPAHKKPVYKQKLVVKKSLKQRAIEFARDNKVPLQVGMSFLASTAGSAYLVSKHLKKKRGYEEAQKKAKADVENYRVNNLQTGNKSIKPEINNLAKGFSETAEQIRKNREKREAEKAERRRLEEEEIDRQRLEQQIQSHPLSDERLHQLEEDEFKQKLVNRAGGTGHRPLGKFGKRRLTLKTLEKDIKVLKRLKF